MGLGQVLRGRAELAAVPVTGVPASQGLCLWLSASLASPSYPLHFTSLLCWGSALGGKGYSGLQAQGSCVPPAPLLPPPRLHRALRRLGGGCLGPSGGDLGSPAPPTPRTRWYCPLPPQVRGTEGGVGPGGEGWEQWGVVWDCLTSPSLLRQAPVSVWDEEEDGATFTVTSRQYRSPDPLVRS